ncbi:MAG: UPF0182 family protein [Candidatus Hydrothermarchaeota archaeon]
MKAFNIFKHLTIISPLLGVIFIISFIKIYPEWLWFSSVNYSSVYWTILSTKLAIAIIVATFFFTFISINFYLMDRAMKKYEIPEITDKKSSKMIYAGIGVFSLIVGIIASSAWKTALLYFNQVPFGVSDPLFNRDIGFYIFSLPFYWFAWNLLFYSAVCSLAIVFLVPFYNQRIPFEYLPEQTPELMVNHYILGGLVFLLLALRFYLNRYEILYSTSGVVFGAGYTDVHIKLPVLTLLTVTCIFGAICIFLGSRFRRKTLPLIGVLPLLIIFILGLLILPGVVQKFKVEPNELALESPYIENNIKYTNLAYGLDKVREKPFPATANLTLEDIEKNKGTIENIRLWDHRPLKATYGQIQEIRLYYEFHDIDIDRYEIDGNYRQVVLSARELLPEKLDPRARTWVNQHSVFTHGYGVVMSPINIATEEGLPELIIRDIPPVSRTDDVKLKRPEIYYGERTDDYVIVRGNIKEFDYPKGEENVYTTYGGKGGVKFGSFFKKLAMTLRFGDFELFISEYITPESRIMFYRNIRERTSEIAPYLMYDRDPYVVISEGKIYWIIDAYTVTDRYPYSELNGRINYIRNSVKAVIDAYNGNVTFYIVDTNDPIIKTYSRMFPDTFKSFDEMPDEIKKHIRYPEDLFSIQVEMYGSYHMKDPQVFYNKEDMWIIPKEVYEEKAQTMTPYYIIMKLPEEKREEFLLMIPYTPLKKDNMIAWIGARCDPPKYGELVLFRFPKGELIYGPFQIEARIDQDPEISKQISLWSQRGSRVIRGNLLAIPIEKSIIYVEPLYIRSEKGELPELKRVILSFAMKVVMEENLAEALNKMFGKRVATKEISEAFTIKEMVAKALYHFNKAEEYLKKGNWTGYGEELGKTKEMLATLNATLGKS